MEYILWNKAFGLRRCLNIMMYGSEGWRVPLSWQVFCICTNHGVSASIFCARHRYLFSKLLIRIILIISMLSG